MNINQILPTDILILIFEKFSLQRQIQLREVCTHWQAIIEALCAKRCTLKLFGRSKNITDFALSTIVDNCTANEGYKLAAIGFDDDLIVDSFIYCDDLAIYSFLRRLFPKLSQLLVHFCWDSPFLHLNLLLQQCHHLTTLSLCGAIDYPHRDFTLRLCATINTMPALKRLDLLVIDLFLLENNKESTLSLPIEMPQVLGQLEHFAISNYKGDLVSVLEQLNAQQCRSLRVDLPRDYDAVELMENLVEDCPELLGALRSFRVSLPDLRDINQVVKLICAHLPRLQCLDLQSCSFINFETAKIDSAFINQMNCLEQLTELRMSHIGISLNLLTEQHYLLPQMPHITVLHIAQINCWPRESHSLYVETSLDRHLWQIIAAIFPKLQEMHIRVKKSSAATIAEYAKLYFPGLGKCHIYSPDELIGEHFGRHKRYDSSKAKGGKFFSECFFDRINEL